MNIINKRYEDTVSFDSLKAGDVFLDAPDAYSIVYMKIAPVIIDGYEFNAVNLSDGRLIGCNHDCHVVAVEAEVSYK